MLKSRKLAAAVLSILAISACQDPQPAKEIVVLGGDDTLLTDASLRTVHKIKPNSRSIAAGRVIPSHITCVEPSPDVATALTKAFSAESTAALSGLTGGVEPEVAAAVASAQVQSIAQLGERLATIQLLRDGLYRACEAYANGAITETTYALMLSRYDDTMISMLLGEFAAGAFGRSLAGISGESAAKGVASLEHKRRIEDRASLETLLSEKNSSLAELESQLKRSRDQTGRLESELTEASVEGSDDEVASLTTQLEDSRKETRRLESEHQSTLKETNETIRDFSLALKAEAESEAKAEAIVAGGITRTQDKDVAASLREMQKQFLDDKGLDALVVACVTALDRQPSGVTGAPQETRLSQLCARLLEKPEVLKALAERSDLLRRGG